MFSTGAPQTHCPRIKCPLSQHYTNCKNAAHAVSIIIIQTNKQRNEGMKRIKMHHQTKQPKNEINIHNGMQTSRMSLSWHGYCIQETIVHKQKNPYVEKISCSSAEEKSFSFPKILSPGPTVLIK